MIRCGNLIPAIAAGRVEERMRRLLTIDWNSLPFHWALTMKRGDGRRPLGSPGMTGAKRETWRIHAIALDGRGDAGVYAVE